MKFAQVFTEADISDKISKDPSKSKRLAIAWRHDSTIPRDIVSSMGPEPRKPEDYKNWEKKLVKQWSDMLETALSRTNYGDLSRDMKYADYLTTLFIDGSSNWEDISGEGGDALGAWHALSIRSKLQPKHQDLRKFTHLHDLQQVMRHTQEYTYMLAQIRNQEHIDKMKRESKQVVLIDDDRFYVMIPLNYGSCYVFNNTGNISNYCTGSSNGLYWFNDYSPKGAIVSIIDKQNMQNDDGKWQFHLPTGQLVNSHQDNRHNLGWNDKHFATLFPGLMRRIAEAMIAKSDEISEKSKEIYPGGYDAAKEVSAIKSKLPISYASRPEGEEPQPEPESQAVQQPEPAPEPIENPVPDEQQEYGRYQQYLVADFRNALSPTNNSTRRMAVYRTDGRRMLVTASSALNAFARIEQERPGWLMPNSIRRISRYIAPRN